MKTFILCFLILAGPILAEEGMWPLYDINKLPLENMKAHGLALTIDQINNPETGLARAVVQLDGGTASFISPEGLLITNHHVAFEAIQKQSKAEQDYIGVGFYAGSQQEEIPAIGYTANVTLSVQDVTKQVLASVNDKMTDLQRYQAIEKASKQIIQKAEKGQDVKCRIARMFGGSQFVLYTYFEIKDIRIVYIPPYAIGCYGGDIDNWMWPRHTGDFSFMRAYVAPDGRAAEYSEKNVPYKPKVYLPIASAGVKEGDITMIIGFPGSTTRNLSSYSIDNLINFYYPNNIHFMEDELAMISDASARDSEIGIRLAATSAGLNNTLKNFYGTMEGFKRANILQQKQTDEQQLTEFLAKDPKLTKKYGYVLPALDSLYKARLAYRDRDFYLGWMISSSDFLSTAAYIHKCAIERKKPDMAREPGYQDRDTADAIFGLKAGQVNLVPSFDKQLFKYFIKQVLQLPEAQKVKQISDIFAGKTKEELDKAIDQYLDDIYSQTKLFDLDQKIAMFHMSEEQLVKLNDPFMNLAISLRPDLDAQRQRQKTYSGAQSRLFPKLIQAYAAWKPGSLYPDANSTMRFNYGTVKGYSPRDAVNYYYMTSLTGVMEKETGKDPFIVPEELKQAYKVRNYGNYVDGVINDLPIDFLSTNDGTGGNSGSPVINGKGEIIGLVFDGNYESVASDYLYDGTINRSINLDIRYVLFLLDKVYGRTALLNELTVH